MQPAPSIPLRPQEATSVQRSSSRLSRKDSVMSRLRHTICFPPATAVSRPLNC
jgi:hypothetical protein